MRKETVGIVDYGQGNILSVYRAFEKIGCKPEVCKARKQLDLDLMVIPGVGSFKKAVRNLKESGLDQVIQEYAAAGGPIVGICLGMQIMLSFGDEGGGCEGLDLIPGRVKMMPTEASEGSRKLPNIGWRPLKGGVDAMRFEREEYYFVHSYYAELEEAQHSLATSTHQGFSFPAIVRNKNAIGLQFHPEKSARDGLELLRYIVNGANFC